MQCDIIAEGIVAALRETRLSLPVIVRLEGTNSDVGREILRASGLPMINAATLAEAAEKAVHAVPTSTRE